MRKESTVELLKKENAALRESNRQLQEAILSMGESKRTQSLVKSQISHDIRTPMNAIVGFASLAQEENNPLKTQNCLKRIEEATAYLLELLNKYMEASVEEAEQKEFSLFGMFQEVKELFERKSREKGILFQLMQEELRTDKVVGNEIQLKQVVVGILSMAFHIAPQNETILFYAKTLHQNDKTTVISLTIKDNDKSINHSYIEKIFLPFEEEEEILSARIEDKKELLVISSLVSLLNGVIKVESKTGEETNVIVEIPFKNRTETKVCQEAKAGNYQFANQRVLLVEDNQLNAEIIEEYLKQVNLSVETVENGRDAVEAFEASKPGYYSLILMDIRMPIMDGRTATQEIRLLPRKDAKRIPIVAMSADAYSEEIKYAQSVGMNGYLTKPIYRKVLYKTIAENLQNI